MRAALISQLADQVAFSFEPEGPLYISKDRMVKVNGNVLLRYSRLDVVYLKLFDKKEAERRHVFVYDGKGHLFLNKQPEDTVLEIDVSPKREVLVEKSGTYLKGEFKRLQSDPVYFYLKYCEIKGFNR